MCLRSCEFFFYLLGITPHVSSRWEVAGNGDREFVRGHVDTNVCVCVYRVVNRLFRISCVGTALLCRGALGHVDTQTLRHEQEPDTLTLSQSNWREFVKSAPPSPISTPLSRTIFSVSCVVVCCGVLQCVAVCCSVLQCVNIHTFLTHHHLSLLPVVHILTSQFYSYFVWYAVATVSRIEKITGLFCKRDL